MKPIKGRIIKQNDEPKPEIRVSDGDIGTAGAIYEINKVRKGFADLADKKIEEVATAVTQAQEAIQEVTDQATEVIASMKEEALQIIKDTKQGEPGDDGLDADEDIIIEKVLEKIVIPTVDENALEQRILKKIPTFDTKSLKKDILASIPDRKADLKIIQESIEFDPISVIEKIMALPEEQRKKLQLSTNNIDGLQQTISSFQSQLGRGYLHGGGISNITGLILPGTNITITGNGTTTSPYVINSSAVAAGLIGSTAGVSSSPTPGVTTEAWLGTAVATMGTATKSNTTFIGNGTGIDATSANGATFIGRFAGQTATNAYNSFFGGESAGYQATNAANSIFIGPNAGYQDTVANAGLPGTQWSILIGDHTNTAGFSHSILMGSNDVNTAENQFKVSYGATSASQVTQFNFAGINMTMPVKGTPHLVGDVLSIASVDGTDDYTLDWVVGGGAALRLYKENPVAEVTPVATGVNTIAMGSGAEALTAGQQVWGTEAGQNSTGATNATFIGLHAGFNSPDSAFTIAIGSNAGAEAGAIDHSVFIGASAGYQSDNADHSNFIGFLAGTDADNANASNFIGSNAGQNALDAYESTFIGTFAGQNAATANSSIFIGQGAGNGDAVDNSAGGYSILIGGSTGTGGFSNSVAIGNGAFNTKANQFMLEDNLINVRWAGVEYVLPAALGTGPAVLTDLLGDGTLSWETNGSGTGTVTGTGAAFQVAFWDSASNISGDNNFQFDPTGNFTAHSPGVVTIIADDGAVTGQGIQLLSGSSEIDINHNNDINIQNGIGLSLMSFLNDGTVNISTASGTYTWVYDTAGNFHNYSVLAAASNAVGFGATSGGSINSNGPASLVFGYTNSAGNITTTGFGSLAHGRIDNGIIGAGGEGSYAAGYTDNLGSITTNADSAHAWGRATSEGTISVNGTAAFGFGRVSNQGQINANSNASMAFGSADGTSSNINTDGNNSIAFGGVQGGALINASGDNSIAFGTANDAGSIIVSRNASLSFGGVDNGGLIDIGSYSLGFGRADGSTAQITASGEGTLVFGKSGGGHIYNNDEGALTFGTVDGDSASTIVGVANSFTFGHAENSGSIETADEGTIAYGHASGDDGLGHFSKVYSGGTASIAGGRALSGGTIIANSEGSQAFGLSSGYGNASVSQILSSGSGSQVFGFANDGGIIEVQTTASLAFGHSVNGTISTTGEAAQVFGTASAFGSISVGQNSIAHGFATVGGIVQATGLASDVHGSAQGVSIHYTGKPSGDDFVATQTVTGDNGAEGTITYIWPIDATSGFLGIATTLTNGISFSGASTLTSVTTTADVNTVVYATIQAGTISHAFGQTYDGGVINATGISQAFGYAEYEGTIEASTSSFAFGTMTGTRGSVTAANSSLAFGNVINNLDGFTANIEASSTGSFAFGSVESNGSNAYIKAQGIGSFAGGYNQTGDTTLAGGNGSFVWGQNVSTSTNFVMAFGKDLDTSDLGNDDTFNVGFGQVDFQVQSGAVLVPSLSATFGSNEMVASDAFGGLVKKALGYMNTSVSSAGTLTLVQGTSYAFSGTTTTWTLPAMTATTGSLIEIKNRGSGNITLNDSAGGNDIYDTSAVATITVVPGQAVDLRSDGTYWLVR